MLLQKQTLAPPAPPAPVAEPEPSETNPPNAPTLNGGTKPGITTDKDKKDDQDKKKNKEKENPPDNGPTLPEWELWTAGFLLVGLVVLLGIVGNKVLGRMGSLRDGVGPVPRPSLRTRFASRVGALAQLRAWSYKQKMKWSDRKLSTPPIPIPKPHTPALRGEKESQAISGRIVDNLKQRFEFRDLTLQEPESYKYVRVAYADRVDGKVERWGLGGWLWQAAHFSSGRTLVYYGYRSL